MILTPGRSDVCECVQRRALSSRIKGLARCWGSPREMAAAAPAPAAGGVAVNHAVSAAERASFPAAPALAAGRLVR